MLEIYADVVFLVNFFMDFLILHTVSKLMKKKPKKVRLAAGAAFMSFAYCLFALGVQLKTGTLMPFLSIFVSVLIAAAAVPMVFPRSDIGGAAEFFKIVFMCYIAALILGGSASVLYYYFNITDILSLISQTAEADISAVVLIASSAVSFILYKLIYLIYRRFFASHKALFKINIYFNNKTASVTALWDTGNELKDPISKAPVIVTEFEAVRGLFSENVTEIFTDRLEDSLPVLLSKVQDSELALSLRMVPYSSVGTKNGLLIGFKPEKIRIQDTERDINFCVVAVYNGKLGGKYNALCSDIGE